MTNEDTRTANDIDLTLDQALEILENLMNQIHGHVAKRVLAQSSTPKWNFPIAYSLTDSSQPISQQYKEYEKEVIRKGISWWSAETCIQFIEYPDDMSVGMQPHLLFVRGTGCLTRVGKQSALQQVVTLGQDCITVNTPDRLEKSFFI